MGVFQMSWNTPILKSVIPPSPPPKKSRQKVPQVVTTQVTVTFPRGAGHNLLHFK